MERTKWTTFGESSMSMDSSLNRGQSQTESSETSYETENRESAFGPSEYEPMPPATVDRGTNTGPDTAPAMTYGSMPPGALDQRASSAVPAAPASYEQPAYGATAATLGRATALTAVSPYADQYMEQPSEAGPYNAASAAGKKYPDEMEGAHPYGILLPVFMCLLVGVILIFMTTFVVTSGHLRENGTAAGTSVSAKSQVYYRCIDVVVVVALYNAGPATSKWVSPAGHVGGLCNASSPCLGHGHCVREICRCDGPHLTVVAGVCQATTTRTASTKHVTDTSDLDISTLPTVQLFTHERTIRLVTDSVTDSEVAVTDSDEEDIKARVEEVRADRGANRTESSNGNLAKTRITGSSKERTQDQSRKSDATRSANDPTEYSSTWESTNEPTNHSASSASGTNERSGSSIVDSIVKRVTERNPGRAAEFRGSSTLGGSANETTSERGASDTVERREKRIAEPSPSQSTERSANQTMQSTTEGVADVTRTEHAA
ncbi:uncharacterized protein LOC119372354 [Rhipicephalus sanguineus]|uniref:uncharacterized protein LOC119372354 n=1 Tax=Rhipicephalus sanguineus TaxID=34632 RepID=UPI0020C2FB26|nr:uncharacterized protein LOC119372354 [Rhipicephalus sanguineus]